MESSDTSSATAHNLSWIGVAVLVGCTCIAGWLWQKQFITTHDPIEGRDLLDYSFLTQKNAPPIVLYLYKGDPLPDTLAHDEEVSKRTETSYTRVVQHPVGNEPGTYTTVIFPQRAFVQEGEDWYFAEYATTTKAAFDAAQHHNPLALLFASVAYAASVSPFSGAGDGEVNTSNKSSWNGARGALTGDNAEPGPTLTTIEVGVTDGEDNDGDDEFDVNRAFVPFDTSVIPAGATISAATLNLYVTFTRDDYNDGFDFITVLQSTQASHTTLTTADFDQCGALDGATEGIDVAERKDITSIATSAYLTFNLNATGLSWVKKSGQVSACGVTAGITCLGLREGHDVLNESNIAGNSTDSTYIQFYPSEQTGTAQDPYLAVTYTTGNFSFWNFSDF